MTFIYIFSIALALAVDAFAVALAIGISMRAMQLGDVLRLSWHFGFFQAANAALGFFFASVLKVYIYSFSLWLAFALLSFVGINMIYSSFQEKKSSKNINPTKGLSLVFLSLATSIDAMAVGFSVSMLDLAPALPFFVTIGVVAFWMTIIAMFTGRYMSKSFGLGRCAEFFGGLVLIFIALCILFKHFYSDFI